MKNSENDQLFIRSFFIDGFRWIFWYLTVLLVSEKRERQQRMFSKTSERCFATTKYSKIPIAVAHIRGKSAHHRHRARYIAAYAFEYIYEICSDMMNQYNRRNWFNCFVMNVIASILSSKTDNTNNWMKMERNKKIWVRKVPLPTVPHYNSHIRMT